MCLVTHLSSMPYHFAILNFILCWLNLLDWNQQQHSNGNNYLFTYHTTGRNYLELDLRNYLNWIYSFHSYISLFIYTWPTFLYLLYDIILMEERNENLMSMSWLEQQHLLNQQSIL